MLYLDLHYSNFTGKEFVGNTTLNYLCLWGPLVNDKEVRFKSLGNLKKLEFGTDIHNFIFEDQCLTQLEGIITHEFSLIQQVMALAKNLNYINVTEPYPLKDLHFYLKHRHIDRIMVRQIDGCVFDLIQNNLLSNVNYLEVKYEVCSCRITSRDGVLFHDPTGSKCMPITSLCNDYNFEILPEPF